MSLHRSHGDVENAQTSCTLSSSDAHLDSNIEVLEYPCDDNSPQSTSFTTARPSKISPSRKRLYVQIWDRITNLFVDWWMEELLAISLSLVAFGVLVFILYQYDGQPLPTLPHNVSLSFVVSTLATISKSSLLLAVASAFGQFKWLWISSKQPRLQDLQIFDEASRGPLGAAKLLASRKGLSWASIGSVVTILCLIFDPFVQGLISVSRQMIFRNDPASLLNRIEDYPDIDISGKYSLQNSISNAAFSPNPISETQPSCPTGNCTWPLFTSLGFCSKCHDISRPLQNSATYVDEGSECDNFHEHFVTTPNFECGIRTRNYTYTFPELNGLSLFLITADGADSPSFNSSFHVTDYAEVPSFLAIPVYSSDPRGLDSWDSTCQMISFIRLSSQYPGFGNVLAADVCALSFCAQKRNVSVSLNQFSSNILQTLYGTISIPKSNSTEFGYGELLSFVGDDFNMTFPSLPIKHYYKRSQPRDESLGKNTATISTWQDGLQYMVKYFGGNVTQPLINASTGFPLGETEPVNWRYFSSASSDIISAFNASSNISMTMDNIATALTNYVRDSSNIKVVGQADQVQIYVHVVWPWIILPAFLVIAGTVFLMLVMLETKRRRACIWKTSELSLLFHGLKDLDQELHALDRLSEMEHAASKIRVKMARTSDGGWILHGEKD